MADGVVPSSVNALSHSVFPGVIHEFKRLVKTLKKRTLTLLQLELDRWRKLGFNYKGRAQLQ